MCSAFEILYAGRGQHDRAVLRFEPHNPASEFLRGGNCVRIEWRSTRCDPRFLAAAMPSRVLSEITSVPHFQDHASDNWEPEGAGSDGVVNRSWSGRRSNMLSWSTCSIW